MPNYVESKTIGPLSYRIEKNGGEYRLWLNGCRIGRPRPDKPAGEIWEFHATTIKKAREAMRTDAGERLRSRIAASETELQSLRDAIAEVEGKQELIK